MKKFLLMAAIAAGTMTANAQVKLNKANVQKAAKVEVATVENATRGVEVPNMYYYRPAGLFYSGWNKAYFNPGVSYGPANTDIHFEANYEGGTPAWVFPSGEFDAKGEPKEDEFQGDAIDVNLPAGRYFTPILVNMDDQKNDIYRPTGYMHIGQSIIKGTTEFEGEEVCNDGYAVNYFPGGNISLLPQYLCTNNEEADAQFQQVIGDDTYHTRGFGESFIPGAQMTIYGFNMLCYAQGDIEKQAKKIKGQVLEFIPGQGINELVDYKGMDMTIDVVEDPTQGFGIYHLLFTLKQPLTVNAGQMIVPMINSTKVQMSPLFDGQPRWDADAEQSMGVTTMFLAAETADGEVYTSVPSLAVTNNEGVKMYLTSWTIGLDMTYGDPNGIENVVVDEANANGSVYTLEGVKVAENGNTENLPAGVYVMNGKKVIKK